MGSRYFGILLLINKSPCGNQAANGEISKGKTKLTSPWDPANLCYPQGFYSNSHSTHWPSLISSSSSGRHLETMSVASPRAHLVRVWYLLESQSLSSRPLVFADLTICTRMGVNSPCREGVISCGDSLFWRQHYNPGNSHFVQKLSWNGGYHMQGPKAFDLVNVSDQQNHLIPTLIVCTCSLIHWKCNWQMTEVL